MKKNQILTQEISKIWNVNKEKKRKCIVDNCQNFAINSHILQKNGIINLICENRHFYILGLTDFFKPQAIFDSPIQFRKIGINEGLSFPLFCNTHDTELFNDIEIGEYNPNLYKTQLLFVYRSVCKELRKKEIQIDIQGTILNNPTIRTEFTDKKIEMTTDLLNGYILGAKDLIYYKKEIESELAKLATGSSNPTQFTFITAITNKLDVCTSTLFSPIDYDTHAFQDEPFKAIFISIFPKDDLTLIICGYHNKFSSNWMSDFTSSWKTLTPEEIQKRISEILITRCETWGISPALFNSMNAEKKGAVVHEFLNNLYSHDEDLVSEINIFEN